MTVLVPMVEAPYNQALLELADACLGILTIPYRKAEGGRQTEAHELPACDCTLMTFL